MIVNIKKGDLLVRQVRVNKFESAREVAERLADAYLADLEISDVHGRRSEVVHSILMAMKYGAGATAGNGDTAGDGHG